MNNILNFSRYKKLVRMYESQLENEIESNEINEGIVSAIKKKISTPYVDKVLSEEIELGKQVEQRIKDTMTKIAEICDSIKPKSNKDTKFKRGLDEIIKEINQTSFDTLSLLGDAKVDFGGFRRSAIMANVVNLSVLLSPIKNALMLRRSYKYFIGLIKQAIRKDLVMLLINFDNFQNMILEKSLETEENSSRMSDIKDSLSDISAEFKQVVKDTMGNKNTKKLGQILSNLEKRKQEMITLKFKNVNNPVLDMYRVGNSENVYKQSAETLKQLINDDNQKMLDSHKNSIAKLAAGDKDGKLGIYGEFLISAAEEKALKTTIEIHTNFLKISEVFKLSNQKELVEMMQEDQRIRNEEIEKEIKERSAKEKKEFDNKKIKFINEEGKKLLDSISSFDEYDKLKGDVNGPNDFSISKKELVQNYLNAHRDEVKDYLKIIVPYVKEDSDYENGYISYVDIIADKVRKMLDVDETGKKTGKTKYLLSFNSLDDESGKKQVKGKFKLSKTKKDKKVTIALKFISDNVVSFDYDLLYDKLKEINTDETTINEETYKEFKKAFDDIKKYKDNDYSLDNENNDKKGEE